MDPVGGNDLNDDGLPKSGSTTVRALLISSATYDQHGNCHDVKIDSNTPSISGQRRGSLEDELGSKVRAAPDGDVGSIEREFSVIVDDCPELLDERCTASLSTSKWRQALVVLTLVRHNVGGDTEGETHIAGTRKAKSKALLRFRARVRDLHSG